MVCRMCLWRMINICRPSFCQWITGLWLIVICNCPINSLWKHISASMSFANVSLYWWLQTFGVHYSMTALLTHIYRSLSVPYIDNEVKERGKKKKNKHCHCHQITRCTSSWRSIGNRNTARGWHCVFLRTLIMLLKR